MMLEDMSYKSFVDFLAAESDLKERQRKERMEQAAFEKYAKEHNLFVCSMELIEQIRAEIADLDDAEYEFEGYYKAVNDALQIIDKYTKGKGKNDRS